MKRAYSLFAAAAIALVMPLPAAAQTMVCTTTTETTTYYLSDGRIVTYTKSIRICEPL